jgi:hypothetical protein
MAQPHKVQDIVSKIQLAGNLMNNYSNVRSQQNDDQFETVYPNHLRDFAPVFEIDTDKELEIMANKFRVLTTTIQSPSKHTTVLGAAPSSGQIFNETIALKTLS